MALSFAVVGRARNIADDQTRTVTDVTFDNSYPTGGEAITAANLGLRKIDQANIVGISTTSATVANAIVDLTNSKILVYTTTGQVANATDLSTVVVRVEAFGK